MRKKLPIRINVVILVGLGYFTLLTLFTVMAIWGEMKIEDAYEVVKGPFMALIGGSLAISKDLLDNPSPTPEKSLNAHPNNEGKQEDREPEPEKPA